MNFGEFLMDDVFSGFGHFLVLFVHVDSIVTDLFFDVEKKFLYAFDEIDNGKGGGVILF